jgi:hypothetical protein
MAEDVYLLGEKQTVLTPTLQGIRSSHGIALTFYRCGQPLEVGDKIIVTFGNR